MGTDEGNGAMTRRPAIERLVHGTTAALTVLGIVAATVIGLDAWADDAATHDAATGSPSSSMGEV
jgi:hypothetical protein